VVDSTAAGDSFNAGYMAAKFGGSTAVDAAKQAHKLASTVIRYRGAIIPAAAMPS
jgi:2-dehydro-3-deoxygluconokinase